MVQFNETTVNIGIRERKLRRILEIVFLLVGVYLTYVFVERNLNIWWGPVLFPLWYQGIRFLYDYSTVTCPLKAELGQSRLDAFMSVFGEPIEDRYGATHTHQVKKSNFPGSFCCFFTYCINYHFNSSLLTKFV